MALLKSIDIPLGSEIPHFTLPDPDGQSYSSQDLFGDKGLLLVVTCNHCPYAVAVWDRVIGLANESKAWGINTVAINPNIHPDYPDDSAENMKVKIGEWGIEFPYLVDETQEVARSFDAQCTPDIYLYDANQKLVYHGRIDDNWQDETQVTRHELREAVSNLAENQPISSEQFPSMGCSIKWK